MQYLLIFQGNNGSANSPQYYVHTYIASLVCPRTNIRAISVKLHKLTLDSTKDTQKINFSYQYTYSTR
jgi:hypothetical protein